jgi:uncharacterized protein YjbJ (UPF0337 family)
MAGSIDKAKGRIKEAAGALADDDQLRREGKLDRAAGAVKEKAERAIDAARNAITGKRRPRGS